MQSYTPFVLFRRVEFCKALKALCISHGNMCYNYGREDAFTLTLETRLVRAEIKRPPAYSTLISQKILTLQTQHSILTAILSMSDASSFEDRPTGQSSHERVTEVGQCDILNMLLFIHTNF